MASNPVVRVLWWALLASLGMYVAVAHVAAPTAGDGAAPEVLAPVFVAVAVAIATATVVVRRRGLAGPIQAGTLDPRTPEGFARAFPAFIVTLVLSEAVGILGLVLAFVSGRPAWSLGFGAAAAALLYLHRPTAPELNPPELGGRPPPIG